jgi:hypothetical protein
MLALRYAALLALALWLGGLMVLGGVAAPAAFEVLGSAGADLRLRAASVVGEMLRRFHLVTYICAAVILLSLMVRAVLGPRPRRFALRLAIAAVMLAATASSGLILLPQGVRAQAEMGVPPSTLPETDERRIAFRRLHRLSTTLQMVPFAGALALVFWELKD